MKERKDCKVVQDLLPNYMENLTSKETNQYVETHLQECEECKKAYESMKKGLNLHTKKADKKEIKYMKKFSSKMRTLKVIILIIVVIFLANTGRKMAILLSLQEKANQLSLTGKADPYITSDNYHRITRSCELDNHVKIEVFSLKDKKKVIQTQLKEGKNKVWTYYITGESVEKLYMEENGKKTVNLNPKLTTKTDEISPLYTENLLQLLVYSVLTSVQKKEIQGKECYYINDFYGVYSLTTDGLYIDKETGLCIRTTEYISTDSEGGKITWPARDTEYDFGTVTEEDLLEPDINGYEIVENMNWQ